MSLHFAKELESTKTHFGSEVDTQLKELIAEYADGTQKPQSLSSHTGVFDH